MQYELFYLVGERQEANLDEIRGEVNAFLTQEGATLIEDEIVEKRKLAYEIKHQRKGSYITRRFELPEIDYWADETNAEKEFGIESITKKLNLNNNVLRFLIVKTTDLPALGAKQRRQDQEMKGEKTQAPAKPQRPQRQEAPKETAKPAPQQAAPQETPKEEAPAKEAKEEKTKDIDKQLDELLNI